MLGERRTYLGHEPDQLPYSKIPPERSSSHQWSGSAPVGEQRVECVKISIASINTAVSRAQVYGLPSNSHLVRRHYLGRCMCMQSNAGLPHDLQSIYS